MKYRYHIINVHSGNVVGTNVEELAEERGKNPTYVVIDTMKEAKLSADKSTPITDHDISRGNPTIVCAAIRHMETQEIILGVRHYDAFMHQTINEKCFVFFKTEGNNMNSLYEKYAKDWKQAEQGFIDQFGDFYTRELAWSLCCINGKPLHNIGVTKKLFSEHLY